MHRRTFLQALLGVVVTPRALLRVAPPVRRTVNVAAMRAVEARIMLPGIQANLFAATPILRLMRERR